MNIKSSNKLGFFGITVSLFFFFNPNFAVVDPIPDIIGYIIMYFSLRRLSDLDYHFDEARKRFKYAIWAGIAELVSLAILFGFVIESEKSLTILTLTFLFGVADMLIVIPAFKNFFEGFSNIGILNNGEAMFKDRKSRGNYTERITVFTSAFIIIKAVGAFLPELTSLIDNSEYRFIGILRTLSAIVVLVVGIIWLISVFRYIRSIYKDKTFIENTTRQYASFVADRPLLFVKRQLLSGINIIFCGLLLSINFHIDYFNVIPNFISATVLLIASFKLYKFGKNFKITGIVSAIYIAVSVISQILSVNFFNNYYPQDAMKNMEIYGKFITMFASNAICEIIFIVLVVCIAISLGNIAIHHTAPNGKDILSRGDLYYDEIRKGKIILIVLTIVDSIFKLYYLGAITSNSSVWYIEMATIFTFAFDIIFVGYAYLFCNTLKSEISHKYINC